jgi:hypothetical protein
VLARLDGVEPFGEHGECARRGAWHDDVVPDHCGV